MQQEQEEEQPRRELRKGDKLGRQGGSGIMTRKRRLPRCDFFASFRHPPSGPQVQIAWSLPHFACLEVRTLGTSRWSWPRRRMAWWSLVVMMARLAVLSGCRCDLNIVPTNHHKPTKAQLTGACLFLRCFSFFQSDSLWYPTGLHVSGLVLALILTWQAVLNVCLAVFGLSFVGTSFQVSEKAQSWWGGLGWSSYSCDSCSSYALLHISCLVETNRDNVKFINIVLSAWSRWSAIPKRLPGYLRWWPIEEIDTAEADYDNGILEFLGKGLCVGGFHLCDP